MGEKCCKVNSIFTIYISSFAIMYKQSCTFSNKRKEIVADQRTAHIWCAHLITLSAETTSEHGMRKRLSCLPSSSNTTDTALDNKYLNWTIWPYHPKKQTLTMHGYKGCPIDYNLIKPHCILTSTVTIRLTIKQFLHNLLASTNLIN